MWAGARTCPGVGAHGPEDLSSMVVGPKAEVRDELVGAQSQVKWGFPSLKTESHTVSPGFPW